MGMDQTAKKIVFGRGYSRRDVLRYTGAAAAGAAAVPLMKSTSAFAAPAFLQGATINLKYGTWFWYEPGRAEAWRAMIEDFHASQGEIRIEESGAAFNDFTNNISFSCRPAGLKTISCRRRRTWCSACSMPSSLSRSRA